MSVAAIVALAHDLVITVGVYALTGFEVTPATVTGFLTILGYSLYDTVVVFDKVRENTTNITDVHPAYLRRERQPRRQPDPGPVDQHLDRGAAAGRRDLVRRRVPARLRSAEGPRAGAVRRYGRRRLLVDLHRDAAARAAQDARAGRCRPRPSGSPPDERNAEAVARTAQQPRRARAGEVDADDGARPPDRAAHGHAPSRPAAPDR